MAQRSDVSEESRHRLQAVCAFHGFSIICKSPLATFVRVVWDLGWVSLGLT
jgi:hypothetical protein